MQKLSRYMRRYGDDPRGFCRKVGRKLRVGDPLEEGRATPTKFAQMKFYEYSKERDISIYQYILNKIQSEAASVAAIE